MDKKNIRMVENYEVISSIYVGDRELILAEDTSNTQGQCFMTCYGEKNEILEFYSDALVSDDYLEIAEIYANRLQEQIAKTKEERVCANVITAEMCDNGIWTENLEGKILVVNPKYLRPEFRNEQVQIILCKGGNGARPEGMGMSIFGQECFSEEKCKYHRGELMGELKREFYPEWLNEKLPIIEAIKNTPNIFCYNGQHFVGIGHLPGNYDVKTTLHSNDNPNMSNYNGGKYNYNEFYKASHNSYFDVFKCIEDDKIYVPGKNELFGYSGEFEIEKKSPKEQTKKKSHKEVER